MRHLFWWELVFFGICWNLASKRVKPFFFSDENILTVVANFNSQDDRVLAQHSEDIPEDMLTVYCCQNSAFVMVWGLQCQTLEISSDVHQWHFGPCLVWYEIAIKKWRFHLPTGRCYLSHPQQNLSLVQRQFSAVLEQDVVAQSQPNGLQYLVHVGNWGLLLTTHNFGVFGYS